MKDGEMASHSALHSTRTVCSCSVLSFYVFSFSCQIEEWNHKARTFTPGNVFWRVFWNIPHFTLCTSLNKVWINYCVHHCILTQQKQSWMCLCYQTHVDIFGCFLKFEDKLICLSQKTILKNKGIHNFTIVPLSLHLKKRSTCDAMYLYCVN